MKSPIYLRRALIAGTAAALAVAGIAVGAAPTFAAPNYLPVNAQDPTTAPWTNQNLPESAKAFSTAGCVASQQPSLTQQPIQTNTPVGLGTAASAATTGANLALQNAPALGVPANTAYPGSPAWFLNSNATSGTASGAQPSGWNVDGSAGIGYGLATCGQSQNYVVASDSESATAGGKWEGPQVGVAADTKTVSVNLYVDSSKLNTNQVAGVFANQAQLGIVYVANPAGALFKNPLASTGTPAIPTTPEANDNAITAQGWYVYNPASGAWTQVAGASTGDGWHNLEIAINSEGNYVYYVDGQTSSALTGKTAATGTTLTDVALTNYNNGFNSTDTWFNGLKSSTNGNPSAIQVNRLSGSDRYATAVAISQSEYPNGFAAGTGVVVLATGANYADALSGAPLAAKYGGVLLLTQPTTLPSEVKAELQRLNPKNVIVLGGYGAVSQAVYTQVQAALPGVKLVQVAGADRYATSLAIAQNYFSSNVNNELDGSTANNTNGNAFVATGTAFPDALSAAPAAGAPDKDNLNPAPAADTSGSFPVLLVNGTSATIPDALALWLKTNVTGKLYVAGGSGAVSPAVVNQLQSNIQGSVVPFSGSDRYDTNILINGNNTNSSTGAFWGSNDAKNLIAPPTTVYLATGVDFPDALTGGAAAGSSNSPLYLTNGTCVPANVLSAIQSFGTVTTINVLGGTGAQAAAIQSLKSC